MKIHYVPKLKPCPFCGGEAKITLIGNDLGKKRKAEIKCTKCFTKQVTGAIRHDLAWCEKTATEQWNTRLEPHPIKEPLSENEIIELFEKHYNSLGIIKLTYNGEKLTELNSMLIDDMKEARKQSFIAGFNAELSSPVSPIDREEAIRIVKKLKATEISHDPSEQGS